MSYRLKVQLIVGLFSTICTILLLFAIDGKPKADPILDRISCPDSDVAPMPLVQDTEPHKAYYSYYAPQENRSQEVRRWLAPSLKIRTNRASGSGTIVYFDFRSGEAYVASCGHLWSGTRSASEVQKNPVSAKVITWYHNEVKLEEPKEYPAQVLFWSNNRGFDSSLLKFRPDWEPDYFPIAPTSYSIAPGTLLHSVGCDGGREVAHYDVEFVEYRGVDLITRRNSPRPGRSGGGLMSSDGYYVGTCWGTSDTVSGGGIGYFTPLKAIHKVFSENEFDWLLDVPQGLARRIPIRDWNNPNQQWNPNYIPLPRDRMPVPHAAHWLPQSSR
jgi:hypothetical protein